MKIPRNKQVWRVLANQIGTGKYALEAAKLEIECGKGTLIATNGRVIVALPVEVGDGDAPGLIPGDAFGSELDTSEDDEDAAFFERELLIENGKATFLRNDGAVQDFPDWKSVIPSADAPVSADVIISAKLLYDAARAMGAEYNGMRLRIPPPTNGVISDPIRIEANGAVGSIMPIVRQH